MKFWFLSATLASLAVCAPALAQPAESAPEVAPTSAVESVAPPQAIGSVRVADGTFVDLELAQVVSSKANKRGDKIAIRLVRPLVIDGVTVLPAGVAGVAEVTTVAPAGMGGKPGELMILARYLDYYGQRIPLRGFKMGSRGADNAALALAASYPLGPFAMFITGGNIEIPIGAKANAKIAAEIEIPLFPASAPEVAPVSEAAPAADTPAS